MTKVACVQLCSGRDLAKNLNAAQRLIAKAARAGALYVQTPENTTIMELEREALFSVLLSKEYQQVIPFFSSLAKEHQIWLHIGSMAMALTDQQAVNRSVVFAPDGEIVGQYDKIHLFDVDLSHGESYRESTNYLAGSRAVMVDVGYFKLGLSICYDLRFASLYRLLGERGAEVLAAPSAFTEQTGLAHWHILLRARAIETTCFVIAAAQAGGHDNGRSTYGHSLIIDPWGVILAEISESAPGVSVADIDLSTLKLTRQRLPVLNNRQSFDFSSTI